MSVPFKKISNILLAGLTIVVIGVAGVGIFNTIVSSGSETKTLTETPSFHEATSSEVYQDLRMQNPDMVDYINCLEEDGLSAAELTGFYTLRNTGWMHDHLGTCTQAVVDATQASSESWQTYESIEQPYFAASRVNLPGYYGVDHSDSVYEGNVYGYNMRDCVIDAHDSTSPTIVSWTYNCVFNEMRRYQANLDSWLVVRIEDRLEDEQRWQQYWNTPPSTQMTDAMAAIESVMASAVDGQSYLEAQICDNPDRNLEAAAIRLAVQQRATDGSSMGDVANGALSNYYGYGYFMNATAGSVCATYHQ